MTTYSDPATRRPTGLFDIHGAPLFEGDLVINLNCLYSEVHRAAGRSGDTSQVPNDAIGPVLWCEDQTGKSGYWSACGTGIWLMSSDLVYGVKLIKS
jgi:hypothetical protein